MAAAAAASCVYLGSYRIKMCAIFLNHTVINFVYVKCSNIFSWFYVIKYKQISTLMYTTRSLSRQLLRMNEGMLYLNVNALHASHLTIHSCLPESLNLLLVLIFILRLTAGLYPQPDRL